MTESDIRWIQRLHSFQNALSQLNEAVALWHERELSKLEKQGLVKAFEFTHEQAWKVMKDYFYYQGNYQITGSRDATREAFKNNLISEGEDWMAMIQTRNRAVHTYDDTIVNEVIAKVTEVYQQCFNRFEMVMKKRAEDG